MDLMLAAVEICLLEGVVMDPIWKASVSVGIVFLPVVLMMLISIVASIYPASIAARIKPVEAIHYKP